MASPEDPMAPGPFLPAIPGFQSLPTTTTPDGVVHVDEELLRHMTPEQRDLFEAYREAFRPDRNAIGLGGRMSSPPVSEIPMAPLPESTAPPDDLPPTPPRMPAPPGGVSGKQGADQNIYALMGRLANDGRTIILPDGTTTTQLPENWAYDPATREIYSIPTPSLDRATFLPLGRRAGGGVELAIPQAIQGALDAIDRAAERARRGLVVPDHILNREAIEVAGMASSGSFGAAQAGRAVQEALTPPPGAARRVAGMPAGHVAEGPVTPLAPGFALGTAGLGDPPRPPRPPAGIGHNRPPPETPQLDRAGFYSQAEKAALEILPARSPGSDMLGQLVNRGRVTEAEIRQLNLDAMLLGDEVAAARRATMNIQEQLANYQQNIARIRAEINSPPSPSYSIETAQNTIKSWENAIQIGKENLAGAQANEALLRRRFPARQVTRDDITEHIRARRVRMDETVRQVPQWSDAVSEKIKILQNALGARSVDPLVRQIGQSARLGYNDAAAVVWNLVDAADRGLTPHSLREALDNIQVYYPDAVPHVHNVLSRYIGTSTEKLANAVPTGGKKPPVFSQYTIDPNNSTNKELIMRIDSPENTQAQAILQTIPQPARGRLMSSWGLDAQGMRAANLSPQTVHEIMDMRAAYASQISKLSALEAKGVNLVSHFDDPSITGFAMTSVLPMPDGRRALFVNQVQSDWTNAIESGKTAAKNVVVSSLNRWVDPMMRRILKDAVEQNTDVIIIPNGATVNTYNGIPGTIARLYDQVYPRRMYEVMREMDAAVQKPLGTTAKRVGSSTGRTTQQLLGGDINRSLGQVFEITPAIREHFARGRGMRLLSGAGDDITASGAIAGTVAAGRPEGFGFLSTPRASDRVVSVFPHPTDHRTRRIYGHLDSLAAQQYREGNSVVQQVPLNRLLSFQQDMYNPASRNTGPARRNPLVMQTADGHLVIVDGNHRLAAALQRGDATATADVVQVPAARDVEGDVRF